MITKNIEQFDPRCPRFFEKSKYDLYIALMRPELEKYKTFQSRKSMILTNAVDYEATPLGPQAIQTNLKI